MTAFLVTALVALVAIAAMGVLADSGLRWWSAFGQLRAEMAMARRPALPLQRISVSYSAFERCPASRTASRRPISRAAA